MIAQAAAQSTGVGQEVHRLVVFDGHLYASYGDYGANTGPIAAVSTPLADPGVFTTEITLSTEETFGLKVLDGRLCAALIDPQGYNDPASGMLAVATAAGSWAVVTTVTPGPEHVMDVEWRDGAWWLSGSAYEGELEPSLGGVASIWTSPDLAAWTRDLAVPTDTGYARFYALLPVADGLVAVMQDIGPTRAWHRPDGGSWAEVEDATPYSGVDESVPFGSGSFGLIQTQKLHTSNYTASGFGLSAPAGAVRAISATGSHAYALQGDGQVLRTSNGTTWTLLFTIDDAAACCLAADEAGGYVYFGTTDSRVLRVALPA